jgi:hypothetical protein
LAGFLGLGRSAPAPRGINKQYENKQAERVRAGRGARLDRRIHGPALRHVLTLSWINLWIDKTMALSKRKARLRKTFVTGHFLRVMG